MSKKKEVLTDDEITIIKPVMTVVNRRLLCTTVSAKMTQDPETKIWTKSLSTHNEKTGKIKDIPRFFVAKTANDIPLDITRPEMPGSLPTGTEVFPFIPPAEDFHFPSVYDTGVGKTYIMLEWPEITGYILPGEGSGIIKK